MRKLYLVRGLPGSGKSTMAANLVAVVPRAVHLETDQFFMVGDVYTFRPERIGMAHKWCQDKARTYLTYGRPVVVSNTFTQQWEMKPYLDMAAELGAEVEIRVARGNYKNIHGVPDAVIERMRQRWED
jgi:predicted kinase